MRNIQRHFILFLALLVATQGVSIAQHSSFHIGVSTKIIDGLIAPYDQIKPGDTLILEKGVKEYMIFRNLSGDENLVITIINGQGQVIIDTEHYFGISVRNCRYIRLTGFGDEAHEYGISIQRVLNGGGLGIGSGSSDVEVDHIAVMHCAGVGINAKTDPDCSFTTTRDKFTQFNTHIHHNYISDVDFEGMYIGSTKYFGQMINCNCSDTLLLPSLLNGVKIHDNIIHNTGWDGIQVSSASTNCEIFRNIVTRDSNGEVFAQMSGILLGGGSDCDCFNNFIADGKGTGIESHGLGGYRIFNNIIKNAGISYLPGDQSARKYGIYISDITLHPDSSIHILHNTIINPKSDGIRFTDIPGMYHSVVNNVIINPGNYWNYENDNSTYEGIDAYVMLQNIETPVFISNNFFSLDIGSAHFANDEFALSADSPLIDSGNAYMQPVHFDFYGYSRPGGGRPDIGAFEFHEENLDADVFAGNAGRDMNAFLTQENGRYALHFTVERSGTVYVNIYNLSGALIQHHKVSAYQSELNTLRLGYGHFKAGIYAYLILNENGTSLSGKFFAGE